jgi:hypothetical protein
MELGMGRPSAGVSRSALLVLALLFAACSETVYEVEPAANLEITGSTADIAPGEVVQLSARVLAANGRQLSNRTITWTSSTDAVAGVDNTGRMTGRTPGSVTITATSEGTTAQRSYTVRSAVPSITSLSPTTALPNTAFQLTVTGSGFYSGSVVRWNGAARPTTFVSGTELRAAIPASDLDIQGPMAITVVNAAPGGGTSNAATLTVRPNDPCQYVPPQAIPGSTSGRIESTDCRLSDGSYSDIFSLSIASAQAVTFLMTSNQLDSYLVVSNAAGDRLFAFNDDTGSSLNSTLTVMIAAGSYRLYATTQPAAQFGDYTLAAQTGPSLVTGCGEYWIMPGIQTTQNLTSSDCSTPAGGSNYFADRYQVYLIAGQSITVTMNSTDVDAWLSILEPGTLTVLAEDDDSAGGNNARVTFTAASEGVYIIEASTFSTAETGVYTLLVP